MTAREMTESMEDVVARRRARLERFGAFAIVAEVAIMHGRPLADLLGPVPRLNDLDKRDTRIAIEHAWRRLYFERFFSTVNLGALFDVGHDTVGRALRRV